MGVVCPYLCSGDSCGFRHPQPRTAGSCQQGAKGQLGGEAGAGRAAAPFSDPTHEPDSGRSRARTRCCDTPMRTRLGGTGRGRSAGPVGTAPASLTGSWGPGASPTPGCVGTRRAEPCRNLPMAARVGARSALGVAPSQGAEPSLGAQVRILWGTWAPPTLRVQGAHPWLSLVRRP